jgi:hypothetical protein
MLDSKKIWIVLFLLVFSISYYLFFRSGFIYYMSDVYVYLAYAESLYDKGVISDMVFDPPDPPITTQNGIVLIYSILRYFVEDMVMRVHIVSTILTFNLFVIFIAIYKIALLLKIDKITIFYLLFAFAFAFYFYGYFVSPTNDGLYASLSLIAIYYVIKIFEENKKSYYSILILIALLAPLFRIQFLVVYIAALISSLLIMKQYKISLFMFLLVLIGYGSISINSYLLIENFSGLRDVPSKLIFANFNLETIGYALFELVNTAIPSAFLNFPATRLASGLLTLIKVTFSLFVIGANVLIFVNSLRNKNFIRLFISLFIIGSFAVPLIFNVIIDRYIYLSVPLLILLATSYVKKIHHYKIFLFLLIANFSIFSFRLYYKSYDFNTIIKNTQFLNENIEHFSLISQIPRRTYFYLNKPSVNNYRLFKENSKIIIIGEDIFIQEKLKKLEILFEILNRKALPLRWPVQNTEVNTIEIEVGYFNDK